MDQDLKRQLKEKGLGDAGEVELGISTSSATPLVVIPTENGAIEHMLKPLNQLYAPDNGRTSIDTDDERDLSLLMDIETTIVTCYRENPELTDGIVELALDRLDMSPSGDHTRDYVADQIQLRLRLKLSLSDYSLQEVRLALRKVRKSVQRHTRHSGRTGYLDFIRYQLTRE